MTRPLADFLINVSDYTFDTRSFLGEGSFGAAYKAVHKTTGEEVAIKFLRSAVLPQDQKTFMRELGILANNQHPATLRLIGFTLAPVPGRKEKGPVIVTPIMPHGTLTDMIKLERAGRAPPEWNPTTKSKSIIGVVAGMAAMHGEHVMHRDLKPENVFVNANFESVIADFGLSKNCTDDPTRTMGGVGSPLFMAPEIYMGDAVPADGTPAYSFSVDVYSFAMLVYLMFSQSDQPKLEGGRSARNVRQLIMHVGRGVRFTRPNNIPEYYWQLVRRCWDHAPTNRPTFAALLEEFQRTHEYVLEGADLAEVMRYEEVLNGSQKPVDDPFTRELDALINTPAPAVQEDLPASLSRSMNSFTTIGFSKSRRKFR
jgi:serine/threonine protein kinase